MDAERLMGAIGRLYDASAAPDELPAALNALADVFGADEAWLVRVDKIRNCATRLDCSGRVYSPGEYADYASHYVQFDDARFVVETLPTGAVFNDVEHVGQAKVDRSPFYQEFLRRNGIRYLLSSSLINSDEEITGLGLHRSARAGCYGEKEKQLMAQAIPHLQRIARLRARFHEIEVKQALGAAALDQLSFGLAVTGDDGRLVLTNRLFDRAVGSSDGLTVRGERLRAAAPPDEVALAQAIRDAIGGYGIGAQPARGTGLRLSRPSGRAAWALVVVPLPARSALAPGARQGALLVLTDPEAGSSTPVSLLRILFRLTAGEARLTARLLQVDSLAEAAAQNGVTLATARHVLKQVFHKTDTHSRPELVKRILQSPLGHLGGDPDARE